MDSLITLDDRGRMVPTDRAALTQFVAGLLDGSLDRPADLRHAGVGLLVLGRHEEAVRLLERALLSVEGRAVVAVHINLGDAHRYRGAFEQAEPHYLEALRLAREAHPGMVHFCLQHLGKQRLDQGQIPAARSLLRLALRQRQALGDVDLIAATRNALRLVEESVAEGRSPTSP
ncbi:tetratricopeptide repeat protein [Kitasatospora sp. NPDC057015]|uniref:tetratricopeptide repeat protein n=1 Tax=Kitasatospora sp. NPDC057015 TaxID=3346001 RepID=UPI003631BD2D